MLQSKTSEFIVLWHNNPTIRRAKRFYSWEGGVAGKRSHDDQKRKFYSWAGKRSAPDSGDEGQMEKRKFYSWAGKRSGYGKTDMELLDLFADPTAEVMSAQEKRKFYSWAG